MEKHNEPVLGLFAITNCQLAERTYTRLKTNLRQILMQQLTGADTYPLGSIPIPAVGGDVLTLAYPQLAGTANDLGVNVCFDSGPTRLPGLQSSIRVLGYHVQMRFQNFTVSNDFGVALRYCDDSATGALNRSLSRDITVTPLGGATSDCEFLIFNVMPFLSLSRRGSGLINASPVPTLAGATAAQDGILQPISHRTDFANATENAVVSSILLFKGLGNPSIQVDLTVTPILVTPSSFEQLKQLNF
jgi:hypothetical protein